MEYWVKSGYKSQIKTTAPPIISEKKNNRETQESSS